MKFPRVRRLPRPRSLATIGVAGLVAGCVATPGPAPVENPIPSSSASASSATTSPRKQSQELSVGIDPVHAGFNPHLLQDDTQFIQTLAGLVLPSAFISGELNADLLTKVEEFDGTGASLGVYGSETATTTMASSSDERVVRTIRYHIAPEAQWSDGTPITAADFQFLWNSMVNNPGTVNPAGYRAITAVRSSGGGKIAEVDFDSRFADWRQLFKHLLPSHLLRGEDFSTVLNGGFPASAGTFTMRGFDRNRGIITLNRNDRFWGKEPARVEVLTFREIRSIAQGVELLDQGQISFMDITPEETATEAFGLVPNTQSRLETDNYVLEVTANSRMSKPLRTELRSLIDPKQLAEVAYGRRTDLKVAAEPTTTKTEAPTQLQLHNLGRELRIAVDPADPIASMAATTLVHMLAKHQVPATIINSDTTDLLSNQIPAGKVDVVVAISGADLAENYACPEFGVLGANRSGFCQPETQDFLDSYFADDKTEEQLQQWVAKLEEEEALRTVIAYDVRLEVLGSGIKGPAENLEAWPHGLSSLVTWRIDE